LVLRRKYPLDALASRLQREFVQRSQPGNSVTGTPMLAHGAKTSLVSCVYGGVRSLPTCGPSLRRTAASSRSSTRSAVCSGRQLSSPWIITDRLGRSATAPTP
jgi:hypothetical protein